MMLECIGNIVHIGILILVESNGSGGIQLDFNNGKPKYILGGN